MSRKVFIEFMVFLTIAVLAIHRLGYLRSFGPGEGEVKELHDLRRNFAELEGLKTTEAALYTCLERARSQLSEVSTVYVPDPADAYAWASRRISHLAHRTGVVIGDVRLAAGPRLRTHRGEDRRQFDVFRCEVECSGTARQILEFVRTAEERNPYLVVSRVVISPDRGDDGLRPGALTFDWPSWRETGLRDEWFARLATAPAPPSTEPEGPTDDAGK